MTRIALSILLVAAAHLGLAQDIYNKARVALSARDTIAAEAGFQEAVKVGQKPAESNYYLGLIAYNRRKLDIAIEFLKASLKADDENVDALKLIGDAYMGKKQVPNALSNYRKAAKIEPKNPTVATAFGLALLAADSVDTAIVQLVRAREFSPDNSAIYAALGDAYMKQNVMALAITNYQKSVELDPKDIETHFKLAKAFEKDRKYNDAVKEYRSVQAIDSTFAEAYFQEGSIWFRTKDVRLYKNAFGPLKTFTRLRPKSFEGMVMYAEVLLSANADSEAVKTSLKALQLDSTAAKTWRLYFYSLVEAKDFKNAESALKSLQKRGPLEVGDYLALGKMYYGLGKDDESLTWYEKAVAADSTNCDPYFNLGSLYMNKQNYGKAATMFEKKIECDPRSLSAYLNAGASHMQTKNYDRARELFLKTIDLKPDFYQGRLWLARYYTQVDSLEKAVEQYDEVLKQVADQTDKKKDACEAYTLKGTVYFIKRQYEKAVDSYRKALALGCESATLQLSLGQALLQTLDPKGLPAENRKKIEDAVKYFRRCIALEPSNGQGHFWLGQGLVMLRVEGDNPGNKKLVEEACSEFRKALRLDPKNEDAKKAMTRISC